MGKSIKMPFNDKTEVAIIYADDGKTIVNYAEVKVLTNAELLSLKSEVEKNRAEVEKEKRGKLIEQLKKLSGQINACVKDEIFIKRLTLFLHIENLIAKGEINEPSGYDYFVIMVNEYVGGAKWNIELIPNDIKSFFANTEVAQ